MIVIISCEKDEILYPVETFAVKLSSGSTKEHSITNRQNGVHSFFVDMGQSFETSKNLYSEFDGTAYATPSFYYNGKVVRYWDGNSFRK